MSDTKVALITAAGSGMGAGAARRLAADGYRVGILSSSGRGAALAEDLGGVGVTGSNRSNADLRMLVDGAMDRWGRIDVLVNSAGHGPKGPLLAFSDEDWHEGLEVFLLAAVRPTRLVAPIMEAQGKGAIVNISSFSAAQPDLRFPVSSVIRAGLSAYTKMCSDVLAPKGVRVNSVLPGFIDSLPQPQDRIADVPAGRMGTVEEVAALIAYLASEAAGFVTGQNIVIDGGQSRRA